MLSRILSDPSFIQPLCSLAGGAMIGATTSINLVLHGRVTGISGIVNGTMEGIKKGVSCKKASNPFQPAFISGLLFTGVALKKLVPEMFGNGWSTTVVKAGQQAAATLATTHPSTLALTAAVASGLLVGIGARVSNGCTSGHGVCGLPRFSRRSIVATMTWFVTAPIAAIAMTRLYKTSPLADQALLALPNLVPYTTPILLTTASLLAFYGFCGARPRDAAAAAKQASGQADSMRTVALNMLFGSMFAGGLVLSGMTQPDRIIGFLDPIYHKWDPSMMFVFGGALGVNIPAFHAILKRPRPVILTKFNVPTSKLIDWKLVGGAAVFGAGWGMGGICPGPGLVALAAANPLTWVWAGSCLTGLRLGTFIVNKFDPLSLNCSKKTCGKKVCSDPAPAKPTQTPKKN